MAESYYHLIFRFWVGLVSRIREVLDKRKWNKQIFLKLL